MFRHRLSPYIVGTCIVTFFALAYVGIRAYQNHVEFKTFISEFEVFQGSLDKDPSHTLRGNEGDASANPENGVRDLLDKQPVKVRYAAASEIGEPSSEGYHVSHSEDQPLMPQWVETPDGTIRVVYTSPDRLIQEGDAIPPPGVSPVTQFWNDIERTGDGWLTIEAEEIPNHIPESERLEYAEKLVDAKERGISIEELERRLASGELKIESASLTPEDERMINAFLEARGEGHLFDHRKQAAAGEEKYQQQTRDATVPTSAGADSVEDIANRSDVPVSPSDLPNVVKPTPSPPSMADLERQLTPAGIEAELSEGLSPERFNKAQQ